MHMANAGLSQGLDIGKERLREYIMSSEGGRQAMGVSAKNNEIGMDTLDSREKKAKEEELEDI